MVKVRVEVPQVIILLADVVVQVVEMDNLVNHNQIDGQVRVSPVDFPVEVEADPVRQLVVVKVEAEPSASSGVPVEAFRTVRANPRENIA